MYLSPRPEKPKRKWTKARFEARKQQLGISNYKCCVCNKSIPESEIPLEAKKKIGLQLYWHNACAKKEEQN